MTTATATLLLFATLLLPRPSAAQQSKFHWLAGEWKLENKNSYEVWTVGQGDDVLIGRAFRVQGPDTVVNEDIRLSFLDNAYHYIPDVAGDQGPVRFTISFADDESFVAENQQHDFPKIIRYRYSPAAGQKKMTATIEGDGKVITYSFVKMK